MCTAAVALEFLKSKNHWYCSCISDIKTTQMVVMVCFDYKMGLVLAHRQTCPLLWVLLYNSYQRYDRLHSQTEHEYFRSKWIHH